MKALASHKARSSTAWWAHLCLSAASFLAPANSLSTKSSPLLPRDNSNTKTPPVTIKGNAFYAGNSRFFIRGVDYQPGGSSGLVDPIAQVSACRRDVKIFQELGINTIRVYTVDNTANHDECMNLLSQAGIYLALDVNTPKYSINRADPDRSYNGAYLSSVLATVDKFAKYDNTLLFFSGNEVINDDPTTQAAPYVKAVTRDIKQYLKSQNLRQIPVGYSAADVDSNRQEMAAYMNCGKEEERADFFAYNDYGWCDPMTYEQSGWDKKVASFKDYGRPVFLSEYGCNKNKRQFGEVSALYGKEMTPVYSGGLVYEYSQEGSNYGLVEITGPNSVKKFDDFFALQTALKRSQPDISSSGTQAGNSPGLKCPAKTNTWRVERSDWVPPQPAGVDKLMRNGAGPGPGLSGQGSQGGGTVGSVGNPKPTSGGNKPSGGSNGDSGGKAAKSAAPRLDVTSSFFSTVLVTMLIASMQ